MAAFVLRRLALALLLVWAVASGAFVLTRLAPGDATIAEAWAQAGVDRAAARVRLGLDRPALPQYAAWLGRALRLDFGESSLYGRPVGGLLRERARNTAVLAAAALLLAAIVGMGAGIYTATHAGSVMAGTIRAASIACISAPPLLTSLVFVLAAARTGWLPVGGMTTGKAAPGWSQWLDVLAHLVLPAISVALPLAATLERVQSQALAEALEQPFVTATRARGVGWADTVRRHAWPVSLAPVLGVYAVMVGALFSGSFAVEMVTAWPGLGRLMVDALRARDLFLVTGTAAAGAVCLAAGTLVGDLAHAALDPRVREVP